MALEGIRYETVISLAQTNEAIRDAASILEHGSDREKVWAAGELDFLMRQKATQQTRLAQIDRVIEAHKHGLSWWRQTWFDFVVGFEGWITHA